MNLKENLIRIWKSKGQIAEGLKNSIFRTEHVEEIAAERMKICVNCKLYSENDSGCMVPGTGPCCDQNKGGCGCSLNIKTRSLSSSCPKEYWIAELSDEEEDQLNVLLNEKNDPGNG